MNNNTVVTISDYQRLSALIELASLRTKVAEITFRLYKKLTSSKKAQQNKIERNIVTMNSTIRLRKLGSDGGAEVTLCYPHDANPYKGKISVFSPMGIQLLGQREGNLIIWDIPSRIVLFEIVKVVYQPEAAGHYFL